MAMAVAMGCVHLCVCVCECVYNGDHAGGWARLVSGTLGGGVVVADPDLPFLCFPCMCARLVLSFVWSWLVSGHWA